MKLGDGQQKPAGTWDWYGQYDPAHFSGPEWMTTFSVGVFQWQPCGKSRPTETKKGKSIKRFSGPIAAPHEVYAKAQAFIDGQGKK